MFNLKTLGNSDEFPTLNCKSYEHSHIIPRTERSKYFQLASNETLVKISIST